MNVYSHSRKCEIDLHANGDIQMTLVRICVGIAAANRIYIGAAVLLLFHALGQTVSTLLKVHCRHFSPRVSAVQRAIIIYNRIYHVALVCRYITDPSSENSPAIEHLHFALVSVNTSVGAANCDFRFVLAVQRTSCGCAAGCPFARHAEGHRYLEHVLPAKE